MVKFIEGGPFDLDITPSWWDARLLYEGGAKVLAALASPDMDVDLKGCGAEVCVSIDAVTLRYERPERMTEQMLRRQRLTIMRALEAAKPATTPLAIRYEFTTEDPEKRFRHAFGC